MSIAPSPHSQSYEFEGVCLHAKHILDERVKGFSHERARFIETVVRGKIRLAFNNGDTNPAHIIAITEKEFSKYMPKSA